MDGSGSARINRGGFLLFAALVSAALLYTVWPFVWALFWAALAAIMFRPLVDAVRPVVGGENRATLLTLLIITFAVVVPAIVIGSIVVRQATQVYVLLRDGGGIDAAGWFDRAHAFLPEQARVALDRSGYGDYAVIEARLSEFLRDSLGLIARRAVDIGGNVFAFVLTFIVGFYTSYFLLRDAPRLGRAIRDALPLDPAASMRLCDSFLSVVRATIKGSVVVGVVQGFLGAITFWIVDLPSVALFGVLMAILSLVPALGPAIVWIPAAAYLLLSGAVWQGLVVIASGVLVIGMADNILRPILVGRDTGLPDWVVLVTTLGGIAMFGLSGIVIGPVVAALFLVSVSILGEMRGIASGEAVREGDFKAAEEGASAEAATVEPGPETT
ncbi:AI-2E family transporter [Aurantiacibacter spongiae]|uniref:AI-2E family transporter n=1 Tax=Aurantiacibacter spongiae TaxID=2488860 RepID=A0A3N5CT95_9SPHN|nr:AI-2E family transporter [Aurantiacibacter spongiae]RPF71887.1 AI-2E family transporter [Aurantiacibacter spongiae]